MVAVMPAPSLKRNLTSGVGSPAWRDVTANKPAAKASQRVFGRGDWAAIRRAVEVIMVVVLYVRPEEGGVGQDDERVGFGLVMRWVWRTLHKLRGGVLEILPFASRVLPKS